MSISNTNKTIPYTVAVASPILYGSVGKDSVKAVNGITSGKQDSKKAFEVKLKEANKAELKFESTAQELHEVHVSTFKGLNVLGGSQFRFRNSHSYLTKPTSDYNHIDLKRHQNYFDQIIHFDRPNGSWVDVKA